MNRTPDLRCFTTEPHIDFADLSCMQDACHMTVCGSVVECRSAESGIWNLRFDSSGELKIFFSHARGKTKKTFLYIGKAATRSYLANTTVN